MDTGIIEPISKARMRRQVRDPELQAKLTPNYRALSLTVRAEVQAEFNQDVQDRLAQSVWTDGGCRSWYLDPDGGTSVLWPGYTWRFRKALKTFDPTDYEFAVAPTAEPSAVAS